MKTINKCSDRLRKQLSIMDDKIAAGYAEFRLGFAVIDPLANYELLSQDRPQSSTVSLLLR